MSNPDIQLLKEARELGCNHDLVQQLADRVEALRGSMVAISMATSWSTCQLIATQALEGRPRHSDNNSGGNKWNFLIARFVVAKVVC